MSTQYRFLAALICFFISISHSFADQINVAVASNALAAIKVVGSLFAKQTGHKVVISSGSTGKLYAQIVNGAPYDIFLAANEKEPQRLEKAGLTAANSRFTYALGKLVAWSSDESLLNAKDISAVFVSAGVSRIAIANPKIAPYGLAAQQVLKKMKLLNSLKGKIIRGENVSQTYQFAATNNAQIGFVAKSQIVNDIRNATGSFWEVPTELYQPIRQQAVLLQRAQKNTAAHEFMDFIKGDNVRNILSTQFGYGVESPENI